MQPLTTASGPFLREGGYLKPRGGLHIAADAAGEGADHMVAVGVVLAHVTSVPVDQVDLALLAGGDQQVGVAGDADRIGQHQRGAGSS